MNLFKLLELWTYAKKEYNIIKKDLLQTKNQLLDHRSTRDMTLKNMLD